MPKSITKASIRRVEIDLGAQLSVIAEVDFTDNNNAIWAQKTMNITLTATQKTTLNNIKKDLENSIQLAEGI